MTGATLLEIRQSVAAALRALEEAQEPDGSGGVVHFNSVFVVYASKI
jgi:hypothetical protein